jgi:hypothetical protein
MAHNINTHRIIQCENMILVQGRARLAFAAGSVRGHDMRLRSKRSEQIPRLDDTAGWIKSVCGVPLRDGTTQETV